MPPRKSSKTAHVLNLLTGSKDSDTSDQDNEQKVSSSEKKTDTSPKESSSKVESNTENTKASAENVEPSTNEKLTYQFTNRNVRLVQANEEPKASKEVRKSFL